jgi:2-amino-4-hydroxy-6-hydroxymethyldihydropteridine diphosphokinase
MPEVVIILGGNLGDVPDTFKKCEERFETLGYELVDISSLYSSPSWGYQSNNPFYNRILVFNTNKNPQEVLDDCLSIENEFGRKRDLHWEYQDRTIDIDILFYGEEIIVEEHLMIPHPRLHERKFCLVPLKEIMPDFVHPGLDKTIRTLLDECEDESKITRE